MQTILVTGGTGYIGSHMSILLLEKGYKVVAVDSFINSSADVLNRIKDASNIEKNIFSNHFAFFEGDVRDQDFLSMVFLKSIENGMKIDGVIHFAGLKSISESISKPINYWEFNVFGTISLLKIMKKFDCKTFIFSSSATIYGLNDRTKISEDMSIKPINPYGNTKATVENFLQDLYLEPKSMWKIANLRYFNPIGSHPSGLIGEYFSDKTRNIFPIINQVAIGKKKKLRIFGNDYATKDGTGVRDYIHVMDLCEGHLSALEFVEDKESIFFNVNLGTGKGISVLELVRTFEKVNNCNVPIKFVARRKGDPSSVVADNSKALALLKWKAKRNIEDMCIDGRRWHLNFINKFSRD